MDSMITAAARALAAGDALGALNRVGLRADAPALAVRGIAMAQLGDLVRAKALVGQAARTFGPKEAVARARCIVAEADIALASRDLGWPAKTLDAARSTLEAHGDRLNAAHARHLEVRRLVLIGRLDEAERALAELESASLPPAWRAAHELVVAGIAMRRLRTTAARTALARAERAARDAGIPALTAEVENASVALNAPAARLIACAWRVQSRRRTGRGSLFPRTVGWGRPPLGLLRLDPAGVLGGGRSARWGRPPRCGRSVGGERFAGCHRRCRDSRRPCYSPRHCR